MPFFGGGGGDYHIVATNIKGGTNAAPAVVGDNNMALGNGALQSTVNADNNVSVGNNTLNAIISGATNTAVGVDAGMFSISGSNNTFVGYGAATEGPDAAIISNTVCLGANTDVFGDEAIAIGWGANANISSVCIGSQSIAYDATIVIGSQAKTTGIGSICIGIPLPEGGATIRSIMLGTASTSGDDAVSIGYRSRADFESVALGKGANAPISSIAIGFDASCLDSGISIGHAASSGIGGIAIGENALAGDAEILIGAGTETVVNIGSYDIGAFVASGGANFWTTDYLAVGLDNVSASVNGSVVNAKLGLWVDDGGTNNVGAGIGKADSTAANAGATMFLARSRGTLAAPAIIQNGDLIGSLIGIGYDGTDYATAARIDFEVDGVPGNDDMPGRMVFKVAPDGSQTVAEAMRISSTGIVSITSNKALVSPGGGGVATNSAVGSSALLSNTTGSYNSAVGSSALLSNTTGSFNSAAGARALLSNTTGTYNSAVGVDSGRYISGGVVDNTTSNTSIYIGANTKALANGDANEIVIGYDATGAGSNSVTLGNISIAKTILYGKVETNATLKTSGYTVATLPAGTAGMRAYVTDALAPTWNAVAVGGGAVTVPVFYNGAAWVTA